MGSYEELGKYYANSRKKFFDNRQICLSFSNNLFNKLKTDLSIPEGKIKAQKVNGHTISYQNGSWKFQISIEVEISAGNVEANDLILFDFKVKYDNNTYKLKVGTKEFQINNELLTLNEVIKYIEHKLYEIYKSDSTYYEDDNEPTIRTIEISD